MSVDVGLGFNMPSNSKNISIQNVTINRNYKDKSVDINSDCLNSLFYWNEFIKEKKEFLRYH